MSCGVFAKRVLISGQKCLFQCTSTVLWGQTLVIIVYLSGKIFQGSMNWLCCKMSSSTPLEKPVIPHILIIEFLSEQDIAITLYLNALFVIEFSYKCSSNRLVNKFFCLIFRTRNFFKNTRHWAGGTLCWCTTHVSVWSTFEWLCKARYPVR